MTSRKIKRIISEIKELENSKEILKESGIYFSFNDEKLDLIYIMFIGPTDTPYENGYYFFELNYPENYPMIPPVMKYCTQGYLPNTNKSDNIKVRFNPNLYTSGKVCLSMLNTWQGPGWVPTNTITNILVAIQALVFNNEPLRNEPGFEDSSSKTIKLYSDVIEFSNFKVSIIDQINHNLGNFEVFREVIKDYFIKNIEKYDLCVDKLCTNKNIKVNTPVYGMNVYLDYKDLKINYNILKTKMLS